MLVNATSGTTASLSGTGTVNAVYDLLYINMLEGNTPNVPEPQVQKGLQLITASYSGFSQGAISYKDHITAMAYTELFTVLVNGQVPTQSDYWGLWNTQDSNSRRWDYDTSMGTFNQYFRNIRNTYRRDFPKGVYVADLVHGVFPEIPSVTPYDAIMSPDSTYASQFQVPVTPAMSTAWRLPSTATSSNPYIRQYDFGVVDVGY
jgi:hypothetical protein